MTEWSNPWMLRLPETIERGVDTICISNCHCLCHWFLSVARVRSGFVLIEWASGIRMGVGRCWRPQRGVGVLPMPEARLDSMGCIESVCESLLRAGVLRRLVPSVAVAVIIDRCCVVDEVIFSPREFFSQDEGVALWHLIVEATELPPWEESRSPAGTERRLFAGWSWQYPEGQRFCWFWWLARVRTFLMARDVTG